MPDDEGMCRAPAPYQRNARLFVVAERRETWHDGSRSRDVPVKIYKPDADRPRPLVVFSHGLGASREYYAYLGRYWAARGYLCVHPTHVGTDCALWRGQQRPWPLMCEAMDAPQHRVDRPLDMIHVLDHLSADADWHATVDWQRVATVGHSFGAYTAMALAGMRIDLPGRKDVSFTDQRVRAVIAMSPQGPGLFGIHEHSWDAIDTPIMFLTGTHDRGVRSKSVADRFVAYSRITGRDQFMVVIKRANHYAFSDGAGIGLRPPPREPEHHGYIQAATTAFLDAYLEDNAAAQRWLVGGGLRDLSGGVCQTEFKNITGLPQDQREQSNAEAP